MLIGVHKRFVFIANTKTASTSIEHALMEHSECMALGNPRRKHMPLSDILKSYHFLFGQPNHKPETYFKFGVMRDPIEWICSWYRYRKGNQVESPLPKDISFEEFWHLQDWTIKLVNTGEPRLQRQMFVDANDQIGADVIIPHGRLDDYFPKICTALKIPCKLPSMNKSIIEKAPNISPSLKAEMREFYARDYELIDHLEEMNAAGMERLMNRGKG